MARKLELKDKWFINALQSVDMQLSIVAEQLLLAGETVDQVKERLRRCMDIVERERA